MSQLRSVPLCDDTEFVTLGDRTVVSRSFRYKGIFTGNKLSFGFSFHVSRVVPHRIAAREDCSGSVSAQVVAKVGAIDQRPADPEL